MVGRIRVLSGQLRMEEQGDGRSSPYTRILAECKEGLGVSEVAPVAILAAEAWTWILE